MKDASTTYRPYLIEFTRCYLLRQNLVFNGIPESRLANPADQALHRIKVRTKTTTGFERRDRNVDT